MGEDLSEEVSLRVKSIIADAEGECSLGYRLDRSNGLVFLFYKILKNGFSDTDELFGSV